MQFFPLEQRPHEMGMELAEKGSSESDKGGGGVRCSVTGCGEILQVFGGLFLIWQNDEPTWSNL